MIRAPPLFQPMILTSDPAFVRHVHQHVMDFEESPRLGSTMRSMGLPNAIPCVTGQPRKRIRRAMETAFSHNTMRDLFPMMLAKANLAISEIQKGDQTSLDTVTMSTRYMIDLMGQCLYDEEYDSIASGMPTEFERIVKRYYETRVTLTAWDLNNVGVLFFSKLAKSRSLTREESRYSQHRG